MTDRGRFALAVVFSLLAHVAILASLPGRKLGDTVVSMAQRPFTVRIVEPEREPQKAEAVSPPQIPAPRMEAPKPRPVPRPRPVERPTPPAPPAEAEAAPQPEPAPPPSRAQPPPLDMLAMIEARRERRREEEQRRRPTVPVPPSDAASRNLETLTGRDGVSGVFQILRKGTLSGEFAFNGWRPSAFSRWRQVYQVEVRPGEDIELAMVQRMIELIRTHYTGDFNWESHRLGRVVVLSARPEDQRGLEDFLMREFFGQAVINRR